MMRDPCAVTVVEPTSGRRALRLDDVWRHRELIYFFVWRDMKVRYKQTLLGATWAVLQPLLMMVVFTVFFGRVWSGEAIQVPYPLFAYAGLLPWTFFALGLTQSSQSVVGSAAMLRKVYFPRLVIPIAAVLSGAVDFLVAFPLVLGLMVYHRVPPSPNLVFAPLFLLLALAVTLAAGTWLAALNVQYRDVRYVAPFFVQAWIFVTPVIYPSATVVERLEHHGIPGWVYGLNPMAAVVEGFRWSLFGAQAPLLPILLPSVLVGGALLVSGCLYFRTTERRFADVV